MSVRRPRVAIVGGGPAGCAMALALHAGGLEAVTVIEARAYAEARIGESVPPDFRRLLARLGLLEAFLAEGHSPCVGSCSSWGSARVGYNDFLVNPHGPGWHLDRQRFERFLADQVQNRGMCLLTDTRFRDIERTGQGGFRLTLGERSGAERVLDFDYVVDAGGLQARLATRLGARKRLHDRLLVASTFLDLDADDAGSQLTVLEAVEYGWWYGARLPRGRAVVAIASDAATLKALRLDTREAWRCRFEATAHVAAAFSCARGPEEEPSVQLAATSVLEPVVGPGWIAIGDAASCFDPLSAQGIHKAFATALRASDVVVRALTGRTGQERASDPHGYAESIRRDFADHLHMRAGFYAQERRWPRADFWAGRVGSDEGNALGGRAQRAGRTRG